MILLLHHWFGIPAAIASPVLDLICYFAAFRLLGKDFLKTSALASVCLAGWFFLWERLPYFLPDLSGHPLAAAVAGAAFIGLGVGLVVRRGASSGGMMHLPWLYQKRQDAGSRRRIFLQT